jgi:hypothetical protein
LNLSIEKEEIMSSFQWDPSRRTAINAEHNLLVSPCKHLYCTTSQEVKYQEKPIDSLRAGHKRLLTRLLVLDVSSSVFYGEIHTTDDVDVLGFLARAWIKKPDHHLHGAPKILNLPRVVQENQQYMEDINFLQGILGFHVGQVPNGFKAGARQLGMLEDEFTKPTRRKDRIFSLWSAGALSAVNSFLASGSAMRYAFGAWATVEPLPTTFRDAIDNRYTDNFWREDQWKIVVEGKDAANLSRPSTDSHAISANH